TDDISQRAAFVLRPNGGALGPRLGGEVQKVFGAAKSGAWSRTDDGTVEIAGHVLEPDEFELLLEPVDTSTTAALRTNDVVVVLDTDVTAELEAEGLARDLIRHIQQARKDADLQVTDRIAVTVRWSVDQLGEIQGHQDTVAAAVLADQILWEPGSDEPAVDITRS
ncbi:MAG: DUF5915 domain-containing protein, partial [Actinomycetota bacterium]|nr:DUF5915 domain-containing protein [Actinomycetota bacterium]